MKKTTEAELPKLIVVLGPTAVGKSDLAVLIAKQIGGEVISADSRQVYTGLNIGAGKITKKEMQGIPHHCLDMVSPTRKKQFNVSEFQERALRAIYDITTRGKVPILCGGTGFYIDSIVDGIVLPEVETNPILRGKLEAYTTAKLVKTLEKLDPERVTKIDQNNRVRMIRSIEIAKTIGKVPKIIRQKKFDTLLIGLDLPKEELLQKVQTRALRRIKQGMIAEAKKLHATGVTWKRMRKLGLEYGLLAQYLQNKLNHDEFTERLRIETWQYAKRQRTWFYKKEGIQWFAPKDFSKISKIVQKFLKN